MTDQPFANYQYEIYLAGLGGGTPALPGDLTRLEELAERHLDSGPFGYVAGSASSERTAQANREAFDRWRIVPRFLRDVSVRDLSTTVLGTTMPAPVLLAPVGVQSIVHADGELATARAASGVGVPFVLSTASSYSLEQVAEAAGDGKRWFQLYWPKDTEVGASLLSRAKAAGYTTLVVTLDTFMLAWRPRDLAGAYLPFLQSIGIANYLSDPAFRAQLAKPPEEDELAAVLHFLQMFGDPSRTWTDLAWLREQWDGPIALKGVLHTDDARRAVDAGIDGIVVSNHGGRQVDGEIATLDALPAIVDAVKGKAEVLLDSGVRTGSDVVKALALGAKAVLLGRPYVYGLGLDGEAGVRHVVRSLLADLDLTLALSGCTSLADVSLDLLAPAPR